MSRTYTAEECIIVNADIEPRWIKRLLHKLKKVCCFVKPFPFHDRKANASPLLSPPIATINHK